MDYIHIDNLYVRGKHGVYAKERKVEQEFSIVVKLGVDLDMAGKSDTLAHTVNYSEVKKKIQTVIEGSSRYLIEKLAEDIAVSILEDSRVLTCEITIKKPEVWDNGVPGVTVFRKK
jgi:dihydroneopterin aldolase